MVSSKGGSGRKKIHEQEYYMDGYLFDNLSIAKKMVKEDWDVIGAYDGYEGTGKSVKAMQDAYFLDPTFNLDRVCFTGEEFTKKIINAEKYQAVVYDEGFSGLSSREAMSRVNRGIIKMLAEIRQKNLFVLIVLPSFFNLDRNVALWRTRFLIHVYINKDRRRGFFSFYNADKKKALYVAGLKYYSYRHPQPNFRGRFYNHYVVSEIKYRNRKFASLKAQLEPKKKELSQKEIETGMKNQFVARIAHIRDLSVKQKAAVMGVAPRTWQEWLTAYNKRVKASVMKLKRGESGGDEGGGG